LNVDSIAAPAEITRVTVAGNALEATWIGPRAGDSPVIVFLHEGLGSIGLWRDFPARLCALIYSRRGHGASEPLVGPRPVDFMHHEALTVLPQLLDHLGIDRPILFGHSDGASIALIFAGGSGRAVVGLILEAPHVFVEDLTLESIVRTRQRYLEGDLRERLGRYHAHLDPLFTGWSDVWLSSAFRAWNIERYVRTIHAPMLLIQGADDEYGTIAQLRAVTAATAGKCRTVILQRCGHAPHVDRHPRVESLAAAFVERLKLNTRSSTIAVDHA
jgi:pimeloyl-ACP methyl ester carboxylesterase